jgi:hypothetical protein
MALEKEPGFSMSWREMDKEINAAVSNRERPN